MNRAGIENQGVRSLLVLQLLRGKIGIYRRDRKERGENPNRRGYGGVAGVKTTRM
jgi:hypothetical protein